MLIIDSEQKATKNDIYINQQKYISQELTVSWRLCNSVVTVVHIVTVHLSGTEEPSPWLGIFSSNIFIFKKYGWAQNAFPNLV